MSKLFCRKHISFCRKAVSVVVMLCFSVFSVAGPAGSQVIPMQAIGLTTGLAADGLGIPSDVAQRSSVTFQPPVLRGMTVHPENPLLFDFIVDRGQDKIGNDLLKDESTKLIKYFLTSMTIPDKDAWVNLSPYEKDRIIPDALGQTEMGRQMLEQDYVLKQLAASLTNPDTQLGKKYWDEVHRLETLDVRRLTLGKTTSDQRPATNDFNKVWIVPDGATVVEKDGFAYITESKLNVMLDVDYGSQNLSSPHALSGDPLPKIDSRFRGNDIEKLSTQVFRDLILPKLIEEVNTGKSFAATRQVYQSVILAAWYKRALKDSLLGRIYADKSKIAGVETDVKDIKQKVYEQYLEAFKKGAYNVIKEEDGPDGETIPRKYFSGGSIMRADDLKVVSSSSAMSRAKEEIVQAGSQVVDLEVSLAELTDKAFVAKGAGRANQVSAAGDVKSSSPVNATLDILKRTAAQHPRLPLVASVIGSLGNIVTEKSINYVYKNDSGNQFGLLPIKLSDHGVAFFRTFLPDSSISEEASVLIFKAGQGNYRGAFDKTGPLAVGIVFFDQRKNKKCLFEFSQLWNSFMITPEWILGNAKKITYPNWKSVSADWFAFKISDEDAMISPANGKFSDGGYVLNLLTIKPLKEQKSMLSLLDDSEELPIKEIFSVNDPASIDVQTAVFENRTILEGKTVHVTGPGAGIDAVMALKHGARAVSFYDTNPAQQLLTLWNLNFARQTGKIPTESKFFPVDGMVDADVYIFNTPAVNTKENIINNVKTQKGYYEAVASRSYFMDAKEFEVIFNQLKDKLQATKNAVAIWRLLISDDAGFLPEGKSYLERVQNFLKQHGLTGEPMLVNVKNVREAGDAHPNLFMIRALKSSSMNLETTSKVHAGATVFVPAVVSTPVAPGGIDFDPSKLNLQIKRDGRGVPLPLPQQDLENINIKGLYPVIINILPVNPQTLPILGQLNTMTEAVL